MASISSRKSDLDTLVRQLHDKIYKNGLVEKVTENYTLTKGLRKDFQEFKDHCSRHEDATEKEVSRIRKDLQDDRENRLKGEKAALQKQVNEQKNRKKFWLKLILGIAGLGAFWEFLPRLIDLIRKVP